MRTRVPDGRGDMRSWEPYAGLCQYLPLSVVLSSNCRGSLFIGVVCDATGEAGCWTSLSQDNGQTPEETVSFIVSVTAK